MNQADLRLQLAGPPGVPKLFRHAAEHADQHLQVAIDQRDIVGGLVNEVDYVLLPDAWRLTQNQRPLCEREAALLIP